ncbi:hypothetical protein H1R20_g12594, partial [Candolleomyces eurysporus]
MPRNEELFSREITQTALAAAAVLQGHGFSCCLFGSAACWYYGMRHRIPHDVDIVVMDDSGAHDAQYFKDLIVQADPNFYLVAARNPEDTYRVLWYRIPRRAGSGLAASLSASNDDNNTRHCKVDILLPGPEPLTIPFIPQDRINYPPMNTVRRGAHRIPLMPFLTLVLLKVRGWSDHRIDHRRRMRDKVAQDEDDVDSLLELAIEKYSTRVEDEADLWEEWFVDEAEYWVDEYAEEWRDSEPAWSEIGFDVQIESDSE